MDQYKTTAGQGLGIVGLILGILAIIFGIIPCTFILGLVFGVIGIVFGTVAYSQSQKSGNSTGLALGALTVSIVGTCIALFLTTLIISNKNFSYKKFLNKIHTIQEKSKDLENIDKTFDNFGDEMEEVLQELEDSLNIDVNVDIEVKKTQDSSQNKTGEIKKSYGKSVKVIIRTENDSVTN